MAAAPQLRQTQMVEPSGSAAVDTRVESNQGALWALLGLCGPALPKDLLTGIENGKAFEPTMTIGQVMKHLRREYPKLSTSKVRFWEQEGLVEPSRGQNGYRRYCIADLVRLRFILRMQAERQLPLRVIKRQLQLIEAGENAVVAGAVMPDPATVEGERQVQDRYSPAELCDAVGVSEDFVRSLVEHRLIGPDRSGLFSMEDVPVVQAAHALTASGFDVRHFGIVKNAAKRQAGLIKQVAEPVASPTGGRSKAQAAELTRELTVLFSQLHSGLLAVELRDLAD